MENQNQFAVNELLEISLKANKLAKIPKLSRYWKSAYEELADAARHLENMIYRTQVKDTAEKKIGA